MSEHFLENNQNFVPVCHYCGNVGHIRPKCQFLDKNNQPNFYENTKGPMYVLHEWITQLTSVVSKLEQRMSNSKYVQKVKLFGFGNLILKD